MHKLTFMVSADVRALGRRLAPWVSVPLVAGAFALLALAERRRPRRKAPEAPVRHLLRNLGVAAAGAIATALLHGPLVGPLSRAVARRRFGLLGRLRLPPWLEVPVAVVLLDYTLYHWHVLTHRVPLLWRFHRVHHTDLDLTASTALRFHFGELSLSVGFRAAQVALLGVAPLPLSIWQTLLLVSTLFHHSNLFLSPRTERVLGLFVVTPGQHGIHHAASLVETDSNWSSGLALWDRLHGTLRTQRIEPLTGLPDLRDERALTLGRLLAMPFFRIKAP